MEPRTVYVLTHHSCIDGDQYLDLAVYDNLDEAINSLQKIATDLEQLWDERYGEGNYVKDIDTHDASFYVDGEFNNEHDELLIYARELNDPLQ